MSAAIDMLVGAEAISPLISERSIALPVNATAVAIGGFADAPTCAVALGDGRIALVDATSDQRAAQPLIVPVHAVAAVHVARRGRGFVTAGQDGRVAALDVSSGGDWQVRSLWETGAPWIEALAIAPATDLVALAYARTIVVVDGSGQQLMRAELDRTVTGLAFDAAGSRIAASRYGGADVLSIATGDIEVSLAWKGAHIGVTWSPDDRYLVTATQEKELHAWDLVTLQDFRMGGYPRKSRSLGWTTSGRHLVASGADVVTAWSFDGAGPGKRPPLEVGFVFGGTVSAIASRPGSDAVAAGFTSGNVQIGATVKGEALVARARTGAAVTGLAWSPCGSLLAAADGRGRLSLFTVPADLGVR